MGSGLGLGLGLGLDAGLCRALGVTAHLQQQAQMVVRAVVQRLDCHGLPQGAYGLLEVVGLSRARLGV